MYATILLELSAKTSSQLEIDRPPKKMEPFMAAYLEAMILVKILYLEEIQDTSS